MRLGLWNRLAIVATILTIIILPLWAISDQNAVMNKDRVEMAKICVEVAGNIHDYEQRTAAVLKCSEDEFKEWGRERGRPDRTFWLGMVALSAALCAGVYLLIWAVVSTARWVWRGRKYRSGIKGS